MENESSIKHEYLAGEVFAMSGAKPEHSLITSEVIVELGLLTRKGSCRTFDSNQRIHIPASGLCTYADAVTISEFGPMITPRAASP
jgi:Uma2 family endonuclease